MMAALLVLMTQGRYLERVFLTPVDAITKEASRFASENIPAEEKLSSRITNTDEIGILASSIDRMEEQITRYVENITSITAENERIGTELSLATRIQLSMLPHEFPPFPERTDIDIFAVMDPAKEVGGDFYDFFLIDDDHLGLIMADVSGKGIPASLFMMASKIILQSVAMLGGSPAEILTRTNEAICSNNQAEMFVTAWVGILELSTGKLTAANAGHEYPALKRADGSFELFKDKHGLVIGAMPDIRYREYELQLEPGDKLFVYTDGVPEASDAENKMFGTQRMLDALNGAPEASPEQLLRQVRRAVDEFVKDAQQFDDLTMLCVEYKGRKQA
jgi:sigma-B regulation protein RsbU (phosphoserine phosphatase)